MCNPPQSPPKAASRRSTTNHNTNNMNTASPASMPVATAASVSLPENQSNSGTAAPSSLKLELAMHRNNTSTTASNNNNSSSRTRKIHVRKESRDEGIDNNSFDDDDVPDLVDEDDVCDSWDEFPTRSSLAQAITPPPIPKPQRLSSTQSLPLAPQKAKARTRSATTSKKQQAKRDQVLPFFCLDCMIEDLVPNKDQKARQDLARILNNNCNNHTHKQRKSTSLPRSTTSEPTFHTDEEQDEPETPIRTPQYPLPKLLSSATTTSKHFSFDDSPLPAVGSADSALSPTNTNTATTATTPPPAQPTTPKSSNRRSYRMRQAMESEERDSNSGNSNNSSNDTMVPRNLQQAFDNIMGAGEEPASSSATTHLETAEVTLSLPKLLPRRKILPPSPTSSSPMISPASSSSSSSPMNKKSNSCPDLSQSNSTDKEDCQRQLRAKEQHNRRERRNKFTVFQRSMTLAQGWNNKGLQMAGKATRAEQYLQEEEQQQQQRQCSPNGHHEGNNTNNAKELWESSLSCWDNALEIYRSLLGDSHERVADVQNNRGIALGKLGLFEDALGALEMALRARQKKHDDAKKNANAANCHPDAAAIVSTLHNIANVYRDAKHWDEALNVLIEAELALRASQDDVLRKNNHTCQEDDELQQQQQQHHLHHCWHQSARLYTAIGHVYYESESWRNSRDAYVQALKVYEKLSRSLRTESNRLGWEGGGSGAGRQRSGNRQSRQQQPATPLSTSAPDEAKRLELLHHHQLIQQEVSILEQDLDELDRCQQAKEGGRARLLQVRQMQQQQQKQKQRTHHPQRRVEEQQPKQQQIKLRPPSSLLGIVNNNNNSLRT